MPPLTTSGLQSILIKTPPVPGFRLFIDDLMKMDPNLANKLRSAEKEEQIVIIMTSETEHIFKLLNEEKIQEAMEARYRLIFCAEAERQKLAAYETVTREQLLKRLYALCSDLEELSNSILDKFPRYGFNDGSRYSRAAAEGMAKHMTIEEIHNRTNHLWFVAGLKRHVLNGDVKSADRVKAIELREIPYAPKFSDYSPPVKKKAPELEAIAEASNSDYPIASSSNSVFLATAQEIGEGSSNIAESVRTETQPLVPVKGENINPIGVGSTGLPSDSIGKRTVASFQQHWRKLQTKFTKSPPSNSGHRSDAV
ncbi:hypothetical protein TWF281_003102 [Arthrobotrys megalospora]